VPVVCASEKWAGIHDSGTADNVTQRASLDCGRVRPTGFTGCSPSWGEIHRVDPNRSVKTRPYEALEYTIPPCLRSRFQELPTFVMHAWLVRQFSERPRLELRRRCSHTGTRETEIIFRQRPVRSAPALRVCVPVRETLLPEVDYANWPTLSLQRQSPVRCSRRLMPPWQSRCSSDARTHPGWDTET
jgi:hypothetical protein